eukprot:11178004-Alexandrium_andersonii.AAC.1
MLEDVLVGLEVLVGVPRPEKAAALHHQLLPQHAVQGVQGLVGPGCLEVVDVEAHQQAGERAEEH